MEMWELVAREQIRDTLARYNWSGDAGRVDDLAETFCRDGILEIRGFEPLRGRAAIAAFLRGVTGGIGVKPIVRHNVSNVLFTELRPGEARVRSYFTVVTHIGLDHCGRYRDLLVPDGGGVADQTPRGVHRLGGARLGHGPVAPAGRRFRSMPGRMFAERPATATDITAHQRIAATPMAPSARRLRNDRRSCDHRSRPRNTKTGRHATTQRARRVLLVPGITDAAAEHLLCDGAGPRHDAGRLHLRAV
ncbi:hypothetical protein PICSAR46_03120 [Mycobacterium avium subsp. paratuberculosis]|nr:hypothetical protein PICSAR180_03333 [Mycobacterium avium subsp. paratuberculosis]CAG7276755.1 hypothetical protein PICSAR55_02516 [Mycobacterium avium subsp. paratuberculosis]CAG7281309.1 hypothetical protein PICSAR46_03120 [Mycobacterium avium subsp. paratuberculosis]CAG7285137.1 hypothetical protein PICSAR47_03463 [Mycobacterium avium subsp. paratuberculosis]